MTELIEELFQQQLKTWPRFTRGIDGLAHAQTRTVRIDWFDVFVRHLPHRVASTTAAVDRDSIAKRPCFLCAENLDPEERGIPFNADYIIYFNPFPILDRHLSIVHRDHRRQNIAGEIHTLLRLAAALPNYFVLYNGPECGASAPDHLHFQAALRTLFPIEKDLAATQGRAARGYRRNVFLFRGGDASQVAEKMEQTIELLSSVTHKLGEPLMNIAAFHDQGRWTVYLFPRDKHRPSVFHTGELTVSPGTIDLCGIFVVPLDKDFARITGEDIASIFKEVTLADDMFENVLARLERD